MGSVYDAMMLTRIVTVSGVVATFVPIAFIAGLACSAEQPREERESGITSAPRRTYSLDAHPQINRLDFDFGAGESSAWLNKGGDFQVHDWISHPNLLCGTYQLGMRFGVGRPGCQNVRWLSEPAYVTSQTQCNRARLEHSGGDTLPEIGAQIAQISCAEKIIRCSGSCK